MLRLPQLEQAVVGYGGYQVALGVVSDADDLPDMTGK